MKGILLVTSLLAWSLGLKAQAESYHPFPTENFMWIGTDWYMYDASCSVHDDYNLFVSGDTVINGQVYHKLYQNGHMWADCPPPGYEYYNEYVGAFNQDSLAKKVFFIRNGMDSAQLAYDFNLSEGDTVSTTVCVVFENSTVQSIDSVRVSSIFHKRYWLATELGVYGYMIEGLGSSFGAFAPMANWLERGSELTCARADDKIYWTESGDSSIYSCGVLAVQDYNKPVNGLTVSPNPSAGIFTLSGNLKASEILQLTNALGQEVPFVKTANQIDLAGQPNGVYYLKSKHGVWKLVVE